MAKETCLYAYPNQKKKCTLEIVSLIDNVHDVCNI